MERGFRELAMHYFEEVARDPDNKDPETLAAYARNFSDDVWRWIAARLDFKEGTENDRNEQ